MMANIGTWDIVGAAIVFSFFMIPLARIFSRAGRSPWMALLFPIPIVGVLWVFAFGRWPALEQKSN